MNSDCSVDPQGWLRQQSGVIEDIFERAASELQTSGIRLRTGSAPPKVEECDSTRKITLSPLRFSNGDELLSLCLLATTRGGPRRYVVMLEISGVATCEAFRRLASNYAEVWERGYLKTGLWVGDRTDWKLLNHLSQITQAATSNLSISGTFLHSDMGRTIQEGLMSVGVLYRSVLDELSGVGKMDRLYAQLSNLLDGRRATYQRIIRP
jgi:hypothetical protein